MTLDELVYAIRNVSQQKESLQLANKLIDWKDSPEDLVVLRDQIEHYLGNTWLSTDEIHSSIYNLWSLFVNEHLSQVQGLTMNERLFTFGLLARYDSATTEGRQLIYTKLLANA